MCLHSLACYNKLMIDKTSSALEVDNTNTPTKKIEKTPPAEELQPTQNTANIQAETANKGISPAIIVLIVILSAVLFAGLVFGAMALLRGNRPYHIEEFQGKTYYIIDKDYDGEYDLQYRLFDDDDLYTYVYESEYNNEEIDEDTKKLQDKDCNAYTEGEERDRCITLIIDDDDSYDDYGDHYDDDYDDYEDDDYYYDYPDIAEVVDYETYEEYCSRWGYSQKYTDPTKQYALFSYISYGSPTIQARLSHVSFENDTITLYVWDNANGATADNAGYLIVVPFDNNEVINLTTVGLYTQEEFNQIRSQMRLAKPVVYLYPQEETEVFVKLGRPDLLTVSYPKYVNEWKIMAKSNGTLIDLNTNRELYSLYYESQAINKPELTEGFVIKGKDSAKFLEEKLEILGLTEREAEEFIIYWLPKLEANNYNLIRFETAEEITKNMPLDISPTPDTVIRVFMDFKALDEEVKIKEQVLETPARTGFTVVEWGGSEL